MCPVKSIVLEPLTAEHNLSDSLLRSAMSSESKPKSFPPPKTLDLSKIPIFVPRNPVESEELVWSPTSGSRKPRPDEIYQQRTNAHPTSPMQFGQGVSPNVGSAYNVRNQYLFHGSRDLSDSPTMGHHPSDSIRMTPPPEFESAQSPLNPAAARPPRSYESPKSTRERGNSPIQMPFHGSVDRMTEMTPMSRDPSKYPFSSYFDDTDNPTNHPSRTDSPSQLKGPRFPSNQARGVYGAEPFSAPPSIPGYGELHQTGQGMHGRPRSPFQEQLGPYQSGPAVPSSRPFPDQVQYARVPGNLNIDRPRPRRRALPNQLPNQSVQPFSRTMPGAQFPQLAPLPPRNTDILVVPPPGSMLPLDYWNMLYQRETTIRTRLNHAHRPMTVQEQEYISLLAEARIDTAATKLPTRNNMSKGQWLGELNCTQRDIWKTGPEGAPFNAVVIARKHDFARAVQRQIEWAMME